MADADLRGRLVESGHLTAKDHTLQAECRRLADFLRISPNAEAA